MANSVDWLAEGFKHIWLPYAQMKSQPVPLPVARTYGSRIVLHDGRELVDGIASWWTACHGYNHPHIRQAVQNQLDLMPHVMFGGLANEPALTLAKRLSALLGHKLPRVFFSDSGSVSVEVAMKMAVQFWLNQGHRGRSKFLAFRGGYHGDTFATMSVCDPDEGMHGLFKGVLPQQIISPLPRDDESIEQFEIILNRHEHELAAIIVEPLVQGAGGMLFHRAEYLQLLRQAANRHNLLLIFDEIFTGFGRTGAMFSSISAGVMPDIMTLSKALTGGTMAFAATLASARVFDGFISDDPKHALMHGPTYMANPLAAAAANASLDLFEREPRLEQALAIGAQMEKALAPCREISWVRDVRVKGAIGVVEFTSIADLAALKRALLALNVWVRPFGNILYLTPALTISDEDLASLTDAIVQVTTSYDWSK